MAPDDGEGREDAVEDPRPEPATPGSGQVLPVQPASVDPDVQRGANEAGLQLTRDLAASQRDIAQANAEKARWEAKKVKVDALQANEDRDVRKWTIGCVGCVATGQVLLADIVFVVYASARGWGNVQSTTMQVWLAATVVQVLAIAVVIARSLFPPK